MGFIHWFACGIIYAAVHIGASATVSREPGQARKGATVAVDLGAGDLLVWIACFTGLYILVVG